MYASLNETEQSLELHTTAHISCKKKIHHTFDSTGYNLHSVLVKYKYPGLHH